MKLKLHYLIFICFFATLGAASAQAPQGMNYQAIARNSSGSILANQNIGVQFTITNGNGGSVLFQESHNTTTNQFGLFTLNIGSGTVSSGTFTGINWSTVTPWLKVGMDATGGTTYANMGSSQLLSTPYALYAESTGGNDWTTSGNNIYNSNSGNVGIGSTDPTLGKLQITPASGQNGIYVNDPVNGYVLRSIASGTSEGIWLDNTNTGTSAATIRATAASGSAEAIQGVDSTGIGVFGVANSGTGVFGYATGEGFGVLAISSSFDAVYAESVSGVGIYASSPEASVIGVTNGAGGDITDYYGGSFNETAGLVGLGEGTSGSTGFSYGVVGEAESNNQYNAGLFGYAHGSRQTNGRNYGVYGLSDDSITAVGMEAIGNTASASGISYGVDGYAESGTQQIGVYGYTVGNTGTCYAGYFLGSLYATSASSSIKAFKIDHPTDPANKFLYHSSVESNDMMDLYNGNITTDANGDALVTLPSYFEALNKDFKYQLTCIGQFAQAIVMNEITNNQFTIKTDKPNVKVSWMVAGVRHDPVADKYRIVNEVEKSASEKGKYLNPDVYGLPISAAINPPVLITKSAASVNLGHTKSAVRQAAAVNPATLSK